MTVALMVDNPNGSEELYERVLAIAGAERPLGGIAHVAGPSPNGGWRVIEVFESQEDAERFFSERVSPAFEAVGADPPPPPQVWRVHNVVTS